MKKALTVIFSGIVIALSACGSRVPPSNHIVIGSTRKIYAIDEKGAEVSISPPFSYYDVSAPSSSVQWSPNREWVIYQTEETASPDDPQVFIIRADGTTKLELTNDALEVGVIQYGLPMEIRSLHIFGMVFGMEMGKVVFILLMYHA